MGKDFEFTINEGTERAKDFMAVFGRRTVCVKSPIQELAKLAGFDEPQAVYMLDLDGLTDDEFGLLVLHIAEKFKAETDVVTATLRKMGMPLLASDGVLTVKNPQKWMLDDAPEMDDEWADLQSLYDEDGDY